MALKTAIKCSDKETIAKLLKKVNAADVRDYDGSTLLHMASKIGDSEIIQFLIDEGCDVNARDRNGATPLLIALEFPCLTKVSVLVKAKANLFLRDIKGMNPLKLALKDDLKSIREELIELFTKHLKVCGLNAKVLAPIMLEAGWPLHYAINIKNSELIKLMIEAGCPINSCDELSDHVTALHKAIANDDSESTKILLEYGADVDIRHENYQSPFMQATTIYPDTNVKIFEMFLARELHRFNTDGMVESYKSFRWANAQIIKLLAKYKVNLTKKDGRGSTILHNLVRNIDPEVIHLISEVEIDVNNKDIDGNTALHYAVDKSSITCLETLIRKGADVNAKNENGHTPLINVINHNESEKVTEILLKNGAILDEEIQNHILNAVITSDKPSTNIIPILKQMAIMHFQSEAVSERNKLIIKNNYKIHYLFKLYWRELDSMKPKQVTANSNVTVFDILCVSEDQLLYYARNEEIVEDFFEMQISTRYPDYSKYMISRLECACNKQNLIQNAIDILFKQLNGNLEVLENIIKYLSFDDLAILCKS